MVLIFTQTTTCLAAEFVDNFSSEKLALHLVRVKKETGVEFTRRYRTFHIIGEWTSVIAAYKTLQHILQEQSVLEEDKEITSCKSLDEIKIDNKEHAAGRKPGHTLKPVERYLPEPLVYVKFQSQTAQTNLRPNEVLPQQDANSISSDNGFANENETGDETDPRQKVLQRNKHLRSSDDRTNDISSEVRPYSTANDVHSSETTVVKYDSSSEIDGNSGGGKCDNEGANYADNVEDVGTRQKHSSDDDTTDTIHNVESVKIKLSKTAQKPIKADEHLTDADILCNSRRKKKICKIKDDKSEKFSCELCPYVGKKRVNLKDHMRVHEKKYSCKVCTEVFGNRTELKRHSIVHEKNNHSKQNNNEQLDENVEFRCKVCPYIGNKSVNLKEHVKRKHRNKYNCDVCDKKFGFNKDLNRHKKEVHIEPKYFCDKCHKLYKSKRVLDEHLKTHKVDYVKPNFDCEICEKTFSTKYVLASHIKSEHLGMKKSYMCPTCGKSFTQKNSYLMHANVHAGIKPYICDKCGKAFTYDKSLKEHRYMHDQIRRFQCHVCEKTFRQTTSLRVHMKVHQDRKDYICTSCGKGFTQKQALLRHERIHSGVKPFICTLCNKAFSDYSIIRRHLILIHKQHPKKWQEHVISTASVGKDYFIKANGHSDNFSTDTTAQKSPLSRLSMTEHNPGSPTNPSSMMKTHLHQPIFQTAQDLMSSNDISVDSNGVPYNYSAQVGLKSINTQQTTGRSIPAEMGQSISQGSLVSNSHQTSVQTTNMSNVRHSSSSHYPGGMLNVCVTQTSTAEQHPQFNCNRGSSWGYASGSYHAHFGMGNQQDNKTNHS